MVAETLEKKVAGSELMQTAVEKVGVDVVAGAVAGMVATLPMTIAMLAMHGGLPNRQKEELPPVEVTHELYDRINVADKVNRPVMLGLSLDAHMGYGMTSGAVYGPLAERVPGHSVAKGIVYGLGVWAINYLGLLPALNLYPSAKEEPARMNALMITAHAIWGGVTGLLTHRLSRALAGA